MEAETVKIIGAIVLVVVLVLVAYLEGRRDGRSRGLPDHPVPPPPPPLPERQWYRLKAHELVVGEVYRDRLTKWPVRVRAIPSKHEGHAKMMAIGVMANQITGVREQVYIQDDDLETDNIQLVPSEWTEEKLKVIHERAFMNTGRNA